MGDDEPATKKRKADSTPPDGYVCRLCSTPGHWIQVCPTKKTGSKKRKSDHTPVPGKEPSEEDIERARELQQIPPPKCFCGLPSRLNKVKRSKAGGDGSRAIGKYFYFCSKKRDDETQCRYARPVEMELKKQKAISKRTKGKADKATGGDKAKKAWEEKKPEKTAKKEMTCKFFAKTGSCKKGAKCEFSHSKKAPEKAPEAQKASKSKKAEDEKDEEAGSNSDESSSVASSGSESSDSDTGEQEKIDGGADDDSSSSDDSSSDSSSDDDSG